MRALGLSETAAYTAGPVLGERAGRGRLDTFLLLVGGSWFVLQVLALVFFQGALRKAAWLSAALMGLALIVAALGVLGGSNLAPIWVVFALPICAIWIAALWTIRGVIWIINR